MDSSQPGRAGGYLDRPHSSSLADVLNVVLDKGLVIDLYAAVSLVGVELLSVDARFVVASADTYLRYAEATSRLDLAGNGDVGLPDLVQRGFEGTVETVARKVAREKTEDAVAAVEEKVGDVVAAVAEKAEAVVATVMDAAEKVIATGDEG